MHVCRCVYILQKLRSKIEALGMVMCCEWHGSSMSGMYMAVNEHLRLIIRRKEGVSVRVRHT